MTGVTAHVICTLVPKSKHKEVACGTIQCYPVGATVSSNGGRQPALTAQVRKSPRTLDAGCKTERDG